MARGKATTTELKRKAFKIYKDKLESTGKVVMKDVLLEAGYSPNTPSTKITKSLSWQKLRERYLNPDLVTQSHSDLLTATKTIYTKQGPKEHKDYEAIAKGVDMAYKVYGQYQNNVELQGGKELAQALDKIASILPHPEVQVIDKQVKDGEMPIDKA